MRIVWRGRDMGSLRRGNIHKEQCAQTDGQKVLVQLHESAFRVVVQSNMALKCPL